MRRFKKDFQNSLRTAELSAIVEGKRRKHKIQAPTNVEKKEITESMMSIFNLKILPKIESLMKSTFFSVKTIEKVQRCVQASPNHKELQMEIDCFQSDYGIDIYYSILCFVEVYRIPRNPDVMRDLIDMLLQDNEGLLRLLEYVQCNSFIRHEIWNLLKHMAFSTRDRTVASIIGRHFMEFIIEDLRVHANIEVLIDILGLIIPMLKAQQFKVDDLANALLHLNSKQTDPSFPYNPSDGLKILQNKSQLTFELTFFGSEPLFGKEFFNVKIVNCFAEMMNTFGPISLYSYLPGFIKMLSNTIKETKSNCKPFEPALQILLQKESCSCVKRVLEADHHLLESYLQIAGQSFLFFKLMLLDTNFVRHFLQPLKYMGLFECFAVIFTNYQNLLATKPGETLMGFFAEFYIQVQNVDLFPDQQFLRELQSSLLKQLERYNSIRLITRVNHIFEGGPILINENFYPVWHFQRAVMRRSGISLGSHETRIIDFYQRSNKLHEFHRSIPLLIKSACGQTVFVMKPTFRQFQEQNLPFVANEVILMHWDRLIDREVDVMKINVSNFLRPKIDPQFCKLYFSPKRCTIVKNDLIMVNPVTKRVERKSTRNRTHTLNSCGTADIIRVFSFENTDLPIFGVIQKEQQMHTVMTAKLYSSKPSKLLSVSKNLALQRLGRADLSFYSFCGDFLLIWIDTETHEQRMLNFLSFKSRRSFFHQVDSNIHSFTCSKELIYVSSYFKVTALSYSGGVVVPFRVYQNYFYSPTASNMRFITEHHIFFWSKIYPLFTLDTRSGRVVTLLDSEEALAIYEDPAVLDKQLVLPMMRKFEVDLIISLETRMIYFTFRNQEDPDKFEVARIPVDLLI